MATRNIYPQPENDYQKFINAFKSKHPCWTNKDIVKRGNEEWSKIKDDREKVRRYIESAPKPPTREKKQSKLMFTKVTNRPTTVAADGEAGMKAAECPAVEHATTTTSTITYPNASNIMDIDKFRDDTSKKVTFDFITQIIQDQSIASKIVDDEMIWKEEVFKTTCASVAKSWGIFDNLRSRYHQNKSKERPSVFANNLDKVSEIENYLKSQFKELVSVVTEAAVGIDSLVRNLNAKKEAMLKIVQTFLNLQSQVTDKDLLNSLRRRLRQMNETKKYLPIKDDAVKLTCRNNNSLTWETALETLIELENGCCSFDNTKTKDDSLKFLSVGELISVANLLKDCTAVSASELVFHLPARLQKEVQSVMKQLATHLPVFLLSKTTQWYVINMFQVGFDCSELNTIFEIESTSNSIPEPRGDDRERGKGTSGGRKCILEKFPNIPEIATDFIKANGFKAQEKRRESTVTSCGVSIKDVRDHLLEIIPGLKEHGLSETSVRYLFKPVKKGTFTAERYKSVIDASVPKKDNSSRADNMDAHYLLSRIKLRRELAAHFHDECTIVSADSMNKIRYGTLAVSRYHQIRKIFLSDDAPKYLDHDFPLPYKTIPDGIMILSKNETDDMFVDDDIVIDKVTKKSNVLNKIKPDESVTDNQLDRLVKSLFRAAYELGDECSNVFQCMSLALVKRGFETITEQNLRDEVLTDLNTKGFSFGQDILYNVNSSEVLNEILWAIAEIYDAKLVLYNSINLTPVVIATRPAPTYTIISAICYAQEKYIFYNIRPIDDPESLKTFNEFEENTSSDSEENDSVVEMSSANVDKLGRAHVPYPHTGPSIIYLRNNFFHSNTCLEHINDLFPICAESVKKGKTCFMIIGDGGPDYNANSYKNEMLYAKLWWESGLDMLLVTCNAAGWSAMNPIEHLWSPLSSNLTSVKLKYSLRSDGVPPCKDTKLTPEEQKLQNKEILDKGAKDISAYWSNVTFDGFPVIPIPVNCDGRPGDVFKSASDICDFLESPLRDIKSGIHKTAHKWYKFLVAHADRRKNEIIFAKCQFDPTKTPCNSCQKHPVKCQKLMDMTKEAQGRMYEPTPSSNHEGHYMTFLEMLHAANKSEFAKPNEHLPRSIGRCEICPSWEFSSVTEAKRHVSLLHPNYKKCKLPQTQTVFHCKYSGCNMVFPSYHSLDKHRKDENHFTRKRKGDDSSKKASNKERSKRASEKLTSFFQSQPPKKVAIDESILESDDEIAHELEAEDGGNSSVVDVDVDSDIEEMTISVPEGSASNSRDVSSCDEISVTVGDYVGAVYVEDSKPYIGRVKEVDDNDVHIDFMEPHVKENMLSQNFKWPARGDDVWVKKSEILCVVSDPEETKRGYKFTSDTCQNIRDLHFGRTYSEKR